MIYVFLIFADLFTFIKIRPYIYPIIPICVLFLPFTFSVFIESPCIDFTILIGILLYLGNAAIFIDKNKIIGVVFNRVKVPALSYYGYGKYGRYGKYKYAARSG